VASEGAPDVRLGDRELPISVDRLVREADRLLQQELGSFWVEGEVSTLRTPQSGHVYFVLKGPRAQLPAILWRSDAARLPAALVEGQRYVCRGKLGVYPEQGRVQLYVDAAEPAGLGAAAQRLAELKKRLAADGLFDPARKRPLPRFPRRIAVVTSPSGAALRDIVRAIWRRFPTPVIISPCKVQGDGAAPDIAYAVRRAGRLPGVAVVIVGRGGGSSEDLSAFNEEPVVRAIATCPVPVVSAVGHEIDVTLADLAADARASTPTGAGEMVVPERQRLLADLAGLEWRLGREARHGIATLRARLERLAARLVHPGRQLVLQRQEIDEVFGRAEAATRAALAARRKLLAQLERRLGAHDPRARLRADRLALDGWLRRAGAAARRILAARAAALGAAGARLDAMSPLRVLERGYALVRRPDGKLVTGVDQAAPGDPLAVRLADGELDVEVRGVRK
jgi:exodeoxyribonuclease VII large subunit